MSSSQTRWKPKWCWVPEPSLVVSNMVHRVQPCAPSKEHRFVQEARMQGSAFMTVLCPTGGSRAAVLPSAVNNCTERCVGLGGNSKEVESAFPGMPRNLTLLTGHCLPSR